MGCGVVSLKSAKDATFKNFHKVKERSVVYTSGVGYWFGKTAMTKDESLVFK